MKRLMLVYNPVSGNASFKQRLDEMVWKFQERGCMLYLYRTAKELQTLPLYIRESGAEGVIAAGGDGTVHEIVNIIMKEELNIPMGIFSSGTSNDFATHLGLAGRLENYIDNILTGRTRWIDLGRIGEEYFINVASAGVMTNIAHEVDVRLKNALGKMAYYLKGIGELPRFRSVKFIIEADGERYEEEGFLFVLVNSDVVAGFSNVAAKAKIDDGKLDFLLVRKCSIPDLMALTAEIVSGRGISEKNVLYLQAKHFRISADTLLQSDVDGELGTFLPLTVETVPRAIEVFV
ncbi:YegS/Rv2252/BmrU family lipid kinase [Selenomonas sputigena]|uniref:YegS/Rv2252/BmrU family lipid kinase n=1 Tax=Selenomonas sputigena TaxID=69823 RepID=A0ABV3X2D1_9FIRM